MIFELDTFKPIYQTENANSDKSYGNTIEEIHHETQGYNYFFMEYILQNKPCILRNITTDWESQTNWVTKDKSSPIFSNLEEQFGKHKIVIYNCSERYFNSQKTTESTFSVYLNYWKLFKKNQTDELLYLKDWHLKLLSPDNNFYQVPLYFASDWMNEYHTSCLDDDYRFVYMGVKGTWTPFHCDVFDSYSWSANICGRKKWILFPPGDEVHLKDNLNNLPYDISQINHYKKYFTVIQNAGDAIFVPTGWHHQVWNLEDTISINHNWVNGCNIMKMWDSLKHNFHLIQKEIEDCRDMDNFEEHCQVLLNASFGMNFEKFYKFLKFIATNRIDMYSNKTTRVLFHGHEIGVNHILFDLTVLLNVLTHFCQCDDISILGELVLDDAKCLCSDITDILKST